VHSCISGRMLKAEIDIRVTSHWVPEQSASHGRLLDSSRRASSQDGFDAVIVPTNRRAESLTACMQLGRATSIPLIVICSKLVRSHEVIRMAEDIRIKAYALDLPADGLTPRDRI